MKHLRCLLVILSALAGCSSDGGVVGSGISSVSGNVVQVELEEPGEGTGATASLLTTVNVSIDEAPGIEALTGVDGSFALEGDFSGDLTLRFRTADRSRDLATRNLRLPEGASVVLEDIGVAPGAVAVAAERILEFHGDIDSVDCAAGTVSVVDNSRRGNRFALQLIADSEIVGRDGNVLSCSDLHPHAAVLVEHSVPDSVGDIVALRLIVSPHHPESPPPSIPARFRGVAVNVNCQAGHVRVDDARLKNHRVRVVLDDSTEFVCSNARAATCSCADLQVGDSLLVEGAIFGTAPDALHATRITRSAPPAVIHATVSGPVVAKDCNQGGFLVEDPRFDEVRIAIHVVPATRFDCTGRPDLTCDCAGLRLREFVTVEGELRERSPVPLVRADSVKVRRGGPPERTPKPTRTPRH